MKLFIYISISFFALSAFAGKPNKPENHGQTPSKKIILERELINARNGETYTCKIYDDSTTEILNEESVVKSVKVAFEAGEEKVARWITELKKSPGYQKAISAKKGIEVTKPKFTDRYNIHRGAKVYSVYEGNKKVAYYKLKGYVPKSSKSKQSAAGSLEYTLKNYQELRGQTDVACKAAMNSRI